MARSSLYIAHIVIGLSLHLHSFIHESKVKDKRQEGTDLL